jgi:hypothetical protein
VLVPADDLHRGDAESLLEHLGRVGGEAAHGLATDLGEVADVGDEAEELALVKQAVLIVPWVGR